MESIMSVQSATSQVDFPRSAVVVAMAVIGAVSLLGATAAVPGAGPVAKPAVAAGHAHHA
jgi:hypothetical protein